ncbi:MAG: hypothetical protein HGB03_04110 [Candidatus Yonathbacteria bacterium]|nr:hypothetical protein [Candidatus Yonathbacteria bacterium]NTW47586.1 hypothetical protein [Candidatus Yonathbacteria bacterium]
MFELFFNGLATLFMGLVFICTQFLVTLGILPVMPAEQHLSFPAPQQEASLTTEPVTQEESEQETSYTPDTTTTTSSFSFDNLFSSAEELFSPKNSLSAPQEQSASLPTEEPAPQTPSISAEELNASARAALVNIMCITTQGGALNPISGSGMIIDPRGIIVTNAHIGEYFLLEHYKHGSLIDCVIRTGGPARITYDATPLFVSSSWVEENAATIVEDNPTGTGEHDIALLFITSSKTTTPLPSSFPFVNYATRESYAPNTDVLVASYPAEYIGGATVQSDLWPVTAPSSLLETFTFQTGSADLISIQGSIASQHGSSGGGVFERVTGKLLGIIATSTDGATTADRQLNAITFGHINSTLIQDTGLTLSQFLADPETQATYFAETEWERLLDMLLAELR